MFPEHKWIPYKLEYLDLSYNNMPVITKEMLYTIVQEVCGWSLLISFS